MSDDKPTDDTQNDNTSTDETVADDTTATEETSADEVAIDDTPAEETTPEADAEVEPVLELSPADRARRERWAREAEATPIRDAATHARRSRRSFLAFGATMAAGFVGFKHIQGRDEVDNIPDVIRRGLETNEAIWSNIGSETRLARTFDIDEREDLRVNGRIGVRDEIDLEAWDLDIVGVDGELIETLSIEDIRALGSHDIVWEHKCIEGWSNIVHWTGARFSALARRYYENGSVPDDHQYVALRTPDEDYYVGLDRETILHPQTLLAWALNDEPLTQLHGAPLRLASPLVYGIKQLKRVGTIEFTNERPPDYWAERGYDWHARF